MSYILYAHTNDNGWSFEGEEPVIDSSFTYHRGLCFCFEADNSEEANEKAKEFAFYFEQEYTGESNITEFYKGE